MPVTDPERFEHAIAAIDAGNADDPNVVTIRSRTGPKEILHAGLMTEWVVRLAPDATEPLLLAARGHHYRRWTVPRSTAPAGRAGYLRWRKSLQAQHARDLGELLTTAGYDNTVVGRVQAIVQKDGLAHDAEVQVLEDALCLVFLETQLADVVARLDPTTLERVLVRTAQKMSDSGSRHDRRRAARRAFEHDPRRRPRSRRRAALPRRSRGARLALRRRDTRTRRGADGPVR